MLIRNHPWNNERKLGADELAKEESGHWYYGPVSWSPICPASVFQNIHPSGSYGRYWMHDGHAYSVAMKHLFRKDVEEGKKMLLTIRSINEERFTGYLKYVNREPMDWLIFHNDPFGYIYMVNFVNSFNQVSFCAYHRIDHWQSDCRFLPLCHFLALQKIRDPNEFWQMDTINQNHRLVCYNISIDCPNPELLGEDVSIVH